MVIYKTKEEWAEMKKGDYLFEELGGELKSGEVDVVETNPAAEIDTYLTSSPVDYKFGDPTWLSDITNSAPDGSDVQPTVLGTIQIKVDQVNPDFCDTDIWEDPDTREVVEHRTYMRTKDSNDEEWEGALEELCDSLDAIENVTEMVNTEVYKQVKWDFIDKNIDFLSFQIINIK